MHLRDTELGDILSEDFWISPGDAKDALDQVRKSVVSFNTDVQRSMAKGTLPAEEVAEWNRWKRQFDAYYNRVTGSFMGWRLVDSTGVLREAEQLSTDLNAWRSRYEAFTKEPTTTPGPVRTHAGPTAGPWESTLKALAFVGAVGLAWRIYNDIRG